MKRILGGIMGFVVGDALGVPVEFKVRARMKKDPVTGMREYGVHNQPKGTWSDDSSMTLCLMDSLTGGYNLDDIAKQFVKWVDEGFWTPYGDVFDIGNTTRAAVNRIRDGVAPVDCGGKREYDNGNGSLMRILPLAYYLINKDESTRYKTIYDVSSITHGHSVSKIACIIYTELAINLIKGNSVEDAYKKMCKDVKSHYEYLDKVLLEPFSRILDGRLPGLSEDDIKSTGYVIDTLEASIWCLMNSKTYSEAVLKAVNLGDDTDTTGAVTGGIAGIVYGFEAIPSDWVDCLARKDDIVCLCKRFGKSLIV